MSAATASLPTRIGRFQVRARLGSGAFAEVYRAHDPQSARDVAVKVVRDGVLGDATAVQRFLREGKVAARLCHPHIVSVFDAGQDGGRYYLAASFIDGQTLAQRLQSEPFQVRAAAVLVRDLAEALQHAHETGVIHRDVKPANMLLESNGSAHLADFGLAHVGESLEKLTQDGTVLGSPAYMAPELAAGGAAPPLPASDQYSLGVVLYELLCGRPPFEGAPAKVLHDAIHTPPPSPRQVKATVPLDLETICLKALAKRPEDRYADCQALADDLRRWLEGEPIRARRLSLVERLARWFKREPKVAWTSLGAACCLFFAALTPLLASVLLGTVQSQEQTERKHLETVTRNATFKAADADKQRLHAESATEQAKTAIKEALEQQERLKQASARLPEETRKQDGALARLEQEQRHRRHAQYAADLNLAFQTYQDKDLRQLLTILKRQQPEPNQEDLRGFEWFYLTEQVRQQAVPSTFVAEQPGAIQVLRFQGPNHLVAASVGSSLYVARYEYEAGLHVYEAGKETEFVIAVTKPTPAIASLPKVERANYERTRIFLSPTETLLTKGQSITESRVVNSTFPENVLRTLKNHKRPISQASFSDDGWTVATLHDPEPDVRVWNLATLKEAHSFSIPNVQRVLLSSDAKTLVTISAEPGRNKGARLQIWDVTKQAERLPAIDLTQTWGWVAFAPDDKVLAVADGNGLLLWDLAANKKRASLLTGERIECLAFSPNSELLACASTSNKGEKLGRFLSLWDVSTGNKQSSVGLVEGLAVGVPSMAFSPDGKMLATVDDSEDTVSIFEAATLRKRTWLKGSSLHPNALAFSANGETLAVGGLDGKLSMWPQSQFESVSVLDGFSAPLTSLAVIPDLAALAVPQGRTICLIDLKTRYQLGVLPEQAGLITCLASAAEGTLLVTGSEDGSVKLWNASTRQEEAVLSGPAAAVHSLGISRDGNRIVAGRDNGKITIWERGTLKELPAPPAQKQAVRTLALTPDGKLLAFAAADNTVQLWSVSEQVEVGVLKGHKAAVTVAAITPDGKTLATASEDGTLKLWDLPSGKERATLHGHKGPVRTMLFSPDGKTVASAGADEKIFLWEAVTGYELLSISATGEVRALAFAPDSDLLVSARPDKKVSFWRVDSQAKWLPDIPVGSLLVTPGDTLKGHPAPVYSVAISPDGKTLASGSGDKMIKLWELATGKERATFRGNTAAVYSLAFSPDGTMLASASWDYKLKMWDLVTGIERGMERGKELTPTQPTPERDSGYYLAISPDGATLASASPSGRIKLWDVATGKERTSLEGRASYQDFVAFSPDSKTLATTSAGGSMTIYTIKLWDVATGKEQATLKGHTSTVASVAFSPDGKTLASASYDKTIKLWNLTTDQEPTTLKGHTQAVTSVIFSRDGKTLVSASEDKTIKLWDVATGQEQATLKGHTQGVVCLAFSPDGKTLASASKDKTIKLWKVTPGQER